MPCKDGMPSELEEVQHDYRAASEKLLAVEAMLCGAVKAFGYAHVVEMLDWTKVGVSKEYFEDWWKKHQERDAMKNQLKADIAAGRDGN